MPPDRSSLTKGISANYNLLAEDEQLRRIGGILLIAGLLILTGWGLWFFRPVFSELPLPLKIAILAIAGGLIILLASLGWERRRASKEEKDDFKEVER